MRSQDGPRPDVTREPSKPDAVDSPCQSKKPLTGGEVRTNTFHRHAEMLPFDPLVIDIGFGNGETTLALAREFWAATIVGIDVHTPGFGALLRVLHDESIANVRICDTDALDVLRWSVRDHSVTLVNVAFPDPWPKAGQQHRRLVQASFLEVLTAKLRVGGTFRFATDWVPYAEQVEELFAVDQRFEQAPAWHDRPTTKFERRGIAEGRPITDLAYLLR